MEGVIKHLRQKQYDVIKAPLDTGATVLRNAEGKKKKEKEKEKEKEEKEKEEREKRKRQRKDKRKKKRGKRGG